MQYEGIRLDCNPKELARALKGIHEACSLLAYARLSDSIVGTY